MNKLREIQKEFPALKKVVKGNRVIYFDGPGGTQVPSKVINAISNYYRNNNANIHGFFHSSIQTDKVIENSRKDVATFLGAENSNCISIGQNMTSLNYSLSRAFGNFLLPGDEIVITQLDHEANRSPWIQLREQGIEVREVGILKDGTLDYADFEEKINERTRLVAMGWASNAFGTVNNIARIRSQTYKVNAYLLIDAVHYAPHFSIDVQKMGVDFLLCSSYKFYGPHLGFLYSKPGLLNTLPTERLKTQEQQAPYSIETGTLNHAALAGVSAAIEYLGTIGEGDNLREKLVSAYGIIEKHEFELAQYLYKGLSKIKSVRIVGPEMKLGHRTPTISIVHDKLSAAELCKKLGDKGMAVWDGHFYALKAIELLGLYEIGGVTRIGISLYNTKKEIDLILKAIQNL